MPNHFLVTANLNQGNSRRTDFSRDGRVLGIAVAKLDKTKILEATGMLPRGCERWNQRPSTSIPALKSARLV